jgi:hypothetical protein
MTSPYTVLHDEPFQSGARNPQGPVLPLKPALTSSDDDDARQVLKRADDCIGAQFENGGDFGGRQVLRFHAED